MNEYENYLQFAKEIAKEAGLIMKKYFSRKDIFSYKGDKTIVTLADKEINSYLIKKSKKYFQLILLMVKKSNLEKASMYGYVTQLMGLQCMQEIYQ